MGMGPRATRSASVDELHHQERGAIRLFQSIQSRNARVIQCGQELRFSLEPREAFGILHEALGQNLDRDLSAELRIARAVDFSHAAGAKRGDDLVNAQAGSRR